MVRKIIVSTALVCFLLGLGISGTVWLVNNRPTPDRVHTAARAPLVDTVVLVREDVREWLVGYGSARASLAATLTAEISAPVVELVDALEEGVAVKRNQVLVRLDDRQYQQDLREAQSLVEARKAERAQLSVEKSNFSALLEIATSDLALNHSDLDRIRELRSDGNAPKKEFDDARLRYQSSLRAKQILDNQIDLLEPRRLQLDAELSAAQSQVGRAELDIERCTIKAPFDGVIESVAVEVGAKVRVGGELLRLLNLDRIEIPVGLPVSVRPRVKVGATVELYVESMPDIRWAGTIARLAPVADSRSRTFDAYVEVDNREQSEELLPGYFVRAKVAGQRFEDALVLPRQAMLDGRVFVVNGHHLHTRDVKILRMLGDRAVVRGELSPGDRVVISNLDMLFEGATVRAAGETLAEDGESGRDGKLEGNGEFDGSGELGGNSELGELGKNDNITSNGRRVGGDASS